MSSFYNPSTGLPNQNASQQGASTSTSGGAGFNPGGFYGETSQNSSSSQQQQQQPHASSQWQQQPTKAAASTSAAASSAPAQEANNDAAAAATTTPPNFWNPAVSAATAVAAAKAGGMSNDAMVDAGFNIASSYLNKGASRMVPGLEGLMHRLRTYFAVDNRYVKKKMVKVLFPVVSKNWRRTEVEVNGEEIIYALPHTDENAPDLYLPFMSAVTYVLLCALLYGTSGKFDPEVLPDVMTKCLVTQSLEVLAIKFGFYTMQAPVSLLDLFSYTGYKYLGLCLNMFVGLGFGRAAYYGALLWTASAASYFVLKVMANNIPRNTAATGPKREFMVLAFAGSQLATMWFLSETKFLS